jgi:SAM-dependent methyltransferase
MADVHAEVPWWHEEAGFFGDFYRRANSVLRFEDGCTLDELTERESSGVVRLCGLEPGARVLDCPCGYGRHSLALARRGMDVTGADINQGFLDAARRARRPRDGRARFVRADMRELPDLGAMDAVVNLRYSFGFFTPEEDRAVLRGFRRCLRPGGRLLLHSMVTAPAFRDGRVPAERTVPLPDGTLLTVRRRLDEATMREHGQWTVAGADGRALSSRRYSVRVYLAEEYQALCREAGFAGTRLFGAWDPSRPYTDDAPYLIVVATAGG